MTPRIHHARSLTLTGLALLALVLAAAPAHANGDDALCDATPECAASFTTTHDCRVTGSACEGTCGVNLTASGATCLHESRFTLAAPAGVAGASVEEEDTTGNVSVTNTRNAWTSDRVTVTARAGDVEERVTLTLLASEQEPGPVTTRQVRADADARGHAAGAGVRFYDGVPRWCDATTPAGAVTLDCSLDVARYLLP